MTNKNKMKQEIKEYSRKQDIHLKGYKTSEERMAFLEGCSFANKES